MVMMIHTARVRMDITHELFNKNNSKFNIKKKNFFDSIKKES